MKVTPATIATRSHQSATQLFARKLRTWRRRISYLRFPRTPLRGAVNGMTWPPCSIGSGAQISPVDQSMHMVGRGVRSRTSSASLLCSFSLISRVMQRVYRSGLRLPADISLVGYSALSSPDITSVCAPLDEIGQLGTDFLIRRLRGENSFSSSKLHTMLPVTLVDSGSAARLDIKKGSSRRLRIRS